MRIIFAVAAIAMLCGCANFDSFRQRLGAPAMVNTENVDDLDAQGVALDQMRSYLRRYDLVSATGANATFSVNLPKLATKPTAPPAPVIFTETPIQVSYTAQNYPILLKVYVSGRREQVDGLCTTFFDGLQSLSSGTQWGQDALNVLVDTGSVIGGLTGASAKKLAVLSGLQIGTNDIYTATKTALLLSPSPHSIYQLVQTKQATVLAQSQPKALVRFEDAERLVRDYAQPCTQNGIRALIDEALQQQTARQSGKVSSDVQAALPEVLNLLNEGAAPAATLNSLKDADAASLYWLFYLAPADDSTDAKSEREAALQHFDNATRERVKAAYDRAEIRDRIKATMEAMGRTYGWVAIVAAEARSAFAASVAADARAKQTMAQQQAQIAASTSDLATLKSQLQAAEAQISTLRQSIAANGDAERIKAEAEARAKAGPALQPPQVPPEPPK